MQHISVPRSLVGTALRRYREERGYTLDMAASLLECDPSKICRIETGRRGIRTFELRALCEEYGIPHTESAVFIALASPRTQHGWWQDHSHVLPEPYRNYLLMETVAKRIIIFDAQQVPDLLRTAGYARAVATLSPAISGEEARRAIVDATLAHKAAILDDLQPKITIVLGEGALYDRAGDDRVMRDQLCHLVELAEGNPRTTIQILPFSEGALAASESSSMRILTLSETPHIEVVYLPGPSGGISVDDDNVVDAYRAAFEWLQRAALSPTSSIQFMRDLAVSVLS